MLRLCNSYSPPLNSFSNLQFKFIKLFDKTFQFEIKFLVVTFSGVFSNQFMYIQSPPFVDKILILNYNFPKCTLPIINIVSTNKVFKNLKTQKYFLRTMYKVAGNWILSVVFFLLKSTCDLLDRDLAIRPTSLESCLNQLQAM